ncbi:unnamed protein product [Lasius platythorax]|uniref:Uncharacterized protein n=1 Tax=Lasius platythorax TaxID=488582 RepID=A0AAV2NTT8_9HYME
MRTTVFVKRGQIYESERTVLSQEQNSTAQASVIGSAVVLVRKLTSAPCDLFPGECAGKHKARIKTIGHGSQLPGSIPANRRRARDWSIKLAWTFWMLLPRMCMWTNVLARRLGPGFSRMRDTHSGKYNSGLCLY